MRENALTKGGTVVRRKIGAFLALGVMVGCNIDSEKKVIIVSSPTPSFSPSPLAVAAEPSAAQNVAPLTEPSVKIFGSLYDLEISDDSTPRPWYGYEPSTPSLIFDSANTENRFDFSQETDVSNIAYIWFSTATTSYDGLITVEWGDKKRTNGYWTDDGVFHTRHTYRKPEFVGSQICVVVAAQLQTRKVCAQVQPTNKELYYKLGNWTVELFATD